MPKALNKIPKALNKISKALNIKPKADFYIYTMSPMGHRTYIYDRELYEYWNDNSR